MNQLTATVKAETSFSIEINGVTHTGFKKMEAWQGMTLYKNNQGTVILERDFGTVLKEAFADGEPYECLVIKISPNLVPVKEDK